MSRVLLTTFGSYGDLHPYLAAAVALKKQGHSPVIATHAEYRDQALRLGLEFLPLKPSLQDVGPEHEWSKKANHPIRGTEFILRTLILPFLEDSYGVLLPASENCDVILSHLLTYAAPMVAEKRKIPWLACMLQPVALLSAYDPPALGPLPFLPSLRFLGPGFFRVLYRALMYPGTHWMRPVFDFRERIGLTPMRKNLMEMGHSPYGNLAMFPSIFAAPQKDWPSPTEQLTFPLFDQETTSELSVETKDFLERGEAPIVFTLGSSIVRMESRFFEYAYDAVKRSGRRAVFLAGPNPQRFPDAARSDPNVHVAVYEPHSKLFPRAHAVVHQCGIGTTAQALASGRPQVLVPFAPDQLDNARRCVALGLGEKVRRLSAMAHALNNVEDHEPAAREFAQKLAQNSFEPMFQAAFEKLMPRLP